MRQNYREPLSASATAPSVTTGSIVSDNYFDAIGVHRSWAADSSPAKTRTKRASVVVISYQLWKGRFNGDPQIIGKTQRLERCGAYDRGRRAGRLLRHVRRLGMQFWVPASMEEVFEAGGYKLEDRGARWIEAYAQAQAWCHHRAGAAGNRFRGESPGSRLSRYNRGRSVKLWAFMANPIQQRRDVASHARNYVRQWSFLSCSLRART